MKHNPYRVDISLKSTQKLHTLFVVLTPHKTRPVGRHRLRWMDQVEEDLKRMKIIGWRMKAEDREEWSKIVEQTKTHPGL